MFFTEGYESQIADLTKMEDAIVSASKFLHMKAEFNELLDWEKIPDIETIESKWYDFEFENEDASFVHEKIKMAIKSINVYVTKKNSPT